MFTLFQKTFKKGNDEAFLITLNKKGKSKITVAAPKEDYLDEVVDEEAQGVEMLKKLGYKLSSKRQAVIKSKTAQLLEFHETTDGLVDKTQMARMSLPSDFSTEFYPPTDEKGLPTIQELVEYSNTILKFDLACEARGIEGILKRSRPFRAEDDI